MRLKRFRAIAPEIPLGYLYYPGIPDEVRALVDDLTYEAYHPNHEMIDADLVAEATAAGRIVNAWTVNDPAKAIMLRDLGVLGIITDNPDTLLAAFR